MLWPSDSHLDKLSTLRAAFPKIRLEANIMKWCWIVYLGRRRRRDAAHVGAEKSRDATRNWREKNEGGGAPSDRRVPSQQGTRSMSTLCVLLLMAVPLDPVLSLTFHLPVNSIKCLLEHVGKDVLVSGEYEVRQQHENTRTTLKVPYGTLAHSFSGACLEPRVKIPLQKKYVLQWIFILVNTCWYCQKYIC